MSLHRSERLTTAPSKGTQELVQPPGTQKSRRTIQQPSGAPDTRSAGPVARPSRSQSAAKHSRAIVEDSDEGNQEDKVDDDGSITDPVMVKQPVIDLIDPALSAAWKVNRKHDMCFIFNPISPARRFKRGMVYDEAANFPVDTCDGDITETDGPGRGWMPVDPGIVGCI